MDFNNVCVSKKNHVASEDGMMDFNKVEMLVKKMFFLLKFGF